MKDQINIRMPDMLGDTVIGTAIVQSVRAAFRDAKINVYATHPDLLRGLKEIDRLYDARTHSADHYDVDLLNFDKASEAFDLRFCRHLLVHEFEMAEQQLDRPLPRGFHAKIHLTAEERARAVEFYEKSRNGKPLIWTQTKTSKKWKDWSATAWDMVREFLPDCAFVDLADRSITPRDAIAITAVADAGIALDSFLLHGAEMVGAQNVAAVMITSSPEVVTYPGQIVIDGNKLNAAEIVAEALRPRITANVEARNFRRMRFMSHDSVWG